MWYELKSSSSSHIQAIASKGNKGKRHITKLTLENQTCNRNAKRNVPTVVIQLETIQLIHKHAHNDIAYKPRISAGWSA